MITPVITDEIDLVTKGFCVTLPCEGCEYAAVSTVIIASSYSTAVLTIKGTLNGDDWYALNEPTISADGLYGPFYIAGLCKVRIEVTTVASGSARMKASWRGWGCIP